MRLDTSRGFLDWLFIRRTDQHNSQKIDRNAPDVNSIEYHILWSFNSFIHPAVRLLAYDDLHKNHLINLNMQPYMPVDP